MLFVVYFDQQNFVLLVESGGLYFNYLHMYLQSLLIIFTYWTQVLESQNTRYKQFIASIFRGSETRSMFIQQNQQPNKN